MFSRLTIIISASMIIFAGLPVQADVVRQPKVEMSQNERWNLFVKNLYILHQRQLNGRKIRTTSRIDGYARDLKYYREVSYYDSANNRLLSRIQWERTKPSNIHVIDVFIYDKKGRVIRDYTAAFLPYRRAAPIQTLINIHSYHRQLHAYRQFDASGFLINERCQGRYRGRTVDIDLDEDDLIEAEEAQKQKQDNILDKADYKACFRRLPKVAGSYLTPQ